MAFARSLFRGLKLAGYFLRFGGELVVRRPKTRAERAAWLNRFCSTVLKGMGIALTVEGPVPSRGAIISNHLGYLDIVVYAALRPVVFVSKAEIANWPGMGWLATMAGTVFVARGQGGSAVRAKDGVAGANADGVPIVFFPEGTTTNGEGLLEFRSGLLAQVLEVGMPVTAAFVQYGAVGVSVTDDVHYWGTVGLMAHIWRFLSLRGVTARVTFAPGPVKFVHGVEERKEAAAEAREAVLGVAAGAGRPRLGDGVAKS